MLIKPGSSEKAAEKAGSSKDVSGGAVALGHRRSLMRKDRRKPRLSVEAIGQKNLRASAGEKGSFFWSITIFAHASVVKFRDRKLMLPAGASFFDA